MTGGPPAISATGLVYRYPGQEPPALRGVDLCLRPGQAVGLLGPNGSGKSTLISLLAGLREPQQGRIELATPDRRRIAWVPQETAFYPDLSCRENLAFFAAMLDGARAEVQRRIDAAIASCMLGEFADRRARHCSGGVRRRLNLAIALLQRPQVLLLDEPTAGVDPQSRAFLLDRVRELVLGGTAVLYATHYMEEVSAVCSDIVLMDHGQVLAVGDLATLLRGDDGTPPHANLEALFMHHTQRSLRD
jgi:ABC-2 type transport system ATP-binding protein